MSNDNSNNKKAPRKPDLESSYVRAVGWDERDNGGEINLTIRINMKQVEERIQEAKDSARDDNRRDERRSETNRSGREDRQPRDNAPRYER